MSKILISTVGLLKKSAPFIFLAAWAFVIHFSFLSYPNQVVFDEFYFGKFVTSYFTHEFYFDIHPPLGKLLIAGFAKLLDFNFVFSFDWVGQRAWPIIFFILRFMPALFGAILVPVVCWLAYLISRSRAVAFIAGLLVLLDNAFLVESKFILVDMFLLVFETLTLVFFFLYQRQRSFSRRWFALLILTGIFLGLSASVKWTGLAPLGIIGVILIIKTFSKKLAAYFSPGARASESAADSLRPKLFWPAVKKFLLKKQVKEAIVGILTIIILGFSVYVIPFAIHFKLLTNYGEMGDDTIKIFSYNKDSWYVNAPGFRGAGFWEKFGRLHRFMLLSSANAITEHPYKSRWYNWPLDSRPMSFWDEEHAEVINEGEAGQIFLFGNPMVWLGSTFFVLFTTFLIFFRGGRRRLGVAHYILILGFLANWLPFIFIKRDAFLYHYLPALVFAILLTSLWLAELANKRRLFALGFLVLVLFAFFSLTLVSYGWIVPVDSFLYKLDLRVIEFFN